MGQVKSSLRWEQLPFEQCNAGKLVQMLNKKRMTCMSVCYCTTHSSHGQPFPQHISIVHHSTRQSNLSMFNSHQHKPKGITENARVYLS